MASISQAFPPVSSGPFVKEACSSCCKGFDAQEASVSRTLKTFSLYKTPNSRFSSSCRSSFGASLSSFQVLVPARSAPTVKHYEENQNGVKPFLLKARSSKSSENSPFTEKYSPKKSRGGGLLEDITRDFRNNAGFKFPAERNSKPELDESQSKSLRDQFVCPPVGEAASESDASNSAQDGDSNELSHEISSQLPELREVLIMLRDKWNEEAAAGKRQRGPGNVFLVGTGPGDPELLTVKALRLMQSADLVLYDRLVSTDILDLVHSGARLLYVGKTSGFHSRTQEEIHELLLNFAEAGATVVRLKGGDPLVFGRGGEEMDFLQDQGIRVQVVPGITAASGIAAELGIPLTHRGVANSVRYLTGHSRKGGDDPLYVADQAADPDSTLVIYMGLATLPGLAAKLLANGLTSDTPAAAIERGTTAQQRTVFATLGNLSTEVKKAELVSPTLIFIGKVVSLSPLWPLKEDRTGTSTCASTKSIRMAAEPRDRRQRGPDPSLPSQQ
ncbi:uroporphyrin-III C-methyltransferase [Marchantia polymorpha subsp. ruderalis]|uniref:uroporphyrinogen-III C-methyltransferase n=2 Tax=Marchantia polymorpha TaxID=3197 RepID=A0AAF6B6L7_MARPO|nr:hypothetical protein MARPO_0087s0054 [Marchantia polymorpha]BBN07651.1 hypothetical protein Mp_4g05350 [Marchantia polymorpha subsp. ruderalis]|eukprot:PTQ33621.1 hypothetical protein MARPO_0087s0054 [Marchantia polymorpha]